MQSTVSIKLICVEFDKCIEKLHITCEKDFRV